MSRLHVTRVRSARELLELTDRKALAAGQGTLRYQIVDPTVAAPNRDVSVMGNAAVGRGAFSYVVDQISKETTCLEWRPLNVCLSSVLKGGMQARTHGDRTERTAEAGGLLMFHSLPGLRVNTSTDSARMNYWLHDEHLTARLETMLDRTLPSPLVFDPPQTWQDGVQRALQRALSYIAAELADPDSFFARGVGIALFDDFMVLNLLEGVPHNFSALLQETKRPAPRHTLRRADAFMRANLDQSISVEQIAQAAGCSSRGLLAAFRAEQGQSITATLRNLRLDAARSALADGNSPLTISSIARLYGFSNPSRFAAAYRERFGEAPADTVGRVKPSSCLRDDAAC